MAMLIRMAGDVQKHSIANPNAEMPELARMAAIDDRLEMMGRIDLGNFELMPQYSNTNELVFDAPKLVAWISKFITMKPGDLIFTGTPS